MGTLHRVSRVTQLVCIPELEVPSCYPSADHALGRASEILFAVLGPHRLLCAFKLISELLIVYFQRAHLDLQPLNFLLHVLKAESLFLLCELREVDARR